MISEPSHRHFGTSLSEWIKRTPNELQVDAVGMWQIVPVGRGDFGLSGEQLRDFVKRSIIELLVAGAIPVRPWNKDGEDWIEDLTFGKSVSEIADNVVREWIGSGIDPDHDGLWFELPRQ